MLETHQVLSLIDSNIPTIYHRQSVNDKQFCEVGVSIQKLLLDIQETKDTFPNSLFMKQENYELAYAISKAYVLAGKNILVSSLDDIVKAKLYITNKIDEYELDKSPQYYKQLMNNPQLLFISDFVSETPSFDESNVNLKLYSGWEYRYLNSFIRGRLENKELSTILYSASDDISHCWSDLLIQIINRHVDLIL